jgi:DNA uptake protein ComE-like DNA-binding protein
MKGVTMNREMRKRLAIAIVVMLSLVLAACGGGESAESDAPDSTALAGASAVAGATSTQSAATANAASTAAAGTAVANAATTPQGAATANAGATQPAVATAPSTIKLNLNTATDADFLGAIPNLGDRMVDEFVEYRPYVSITQFREEIGEYVSADQVAMYEQYVYVPIDVDQADAETLQQLPGVDATIADALIAGRPYGSNDAFLAKLAENVSDADLALARVYLLTK